MDKENVFDNESIWILEQIMEPLYTVSPDGKGVVPWLAKSYTLSPDKKTYTFHLRPGVKFSNGKPMTSADVKFSIDQTRKAAQGWGYLDAAIKDITTPNPETVVIQTKYPWAPFMADIALFANGIVPNNYVGETAEGVLHPPDRHRPVHVGPLDARRRDRAQAQPVLLAEGQAVSRPASRGRRSPTRTPASSSSRAARRRSTSSPTGRRSTRSRTRRASP